MGPTQLANPSGLEYRESRLLGVVHLHLLRDLTSKEPFLNVAKLEAVLCEETGRVYLPSASNQHRPDRSALTTGKIQVCDLLTGLVTGTAGRFAKCTVDHWKPPQG